MPKMSSADLKLVQPAAGTTPPAQAAAAAGTPADDADTDSAPGDKTAAEPAEPASSSAFGASDAERQAVQGKGKGKGSVLFSSLKGASIFGSSIDEQAQEQTELNVRQPFPSLPSAPST